MRFMGFGKFPVWLVAPDGVGESRAAGQECGGQNWGDWGPGEGGMVARALQDKALAGLDLVTGGALA